MPKKTPKVSVLMPAYNVEKYVCAAIESILNQTFSDFEFIIINDGSTDNTAKIIKEYAKKDKRIRFINHSKNKGLIAVLNEGFDLCNGEYIARMDSDDISLPERFAKQVEYMDSHPECGVVGAWIEQFGDNVKSFIYEYPGQMKLLDFVIHGNQVAHPCTLIRRKILDKHNIRYNSGYKYAEDYAFWTEIVKYAELHNLQEILLRYRWYGNNVSIVHRREQYECAERIRKNILSNLVSSDYEINKLLRMTRETIERFYLFGFLPIIRRKQYSLEKTKYYLFEKIPLIKVQDNKIYLFEKIKIGHLK